MIIISKIINDEGDEPLRFREISQGDIYEFLSQGTERKDIDVTLDLLQWGSITEPYRAYYGLVSADVIANWYNEYGNSLFSQNIRYFKVDSEVNLEIMETLSSDPGNFFYYNNGIKLLCSRVDKTLANAGNHEVGHFELHNLSVVNGAQTTGAIARSYEKDPEKVGRAKVLLEIIDLSDMPDDAASRITRHSNMQNRVDGKDFASLDPQQERLRKELLMETPRINYVYRTSSTENDGERVITLDQATPALACLNSDVALSTMAKSKLGALTASISKPPYTRLFNESLSAIAMYNAVQIMTGVEHSLNNVRKGLGSNVSPLILIHGNRFLLHLVLQELKATKELGDEILQEQEIDEMISPLLKKYIAKTQDAVSNLFPASYPANIFKNQQKCQKIKDFVLKE
ncbi:AIPR family protein [Bifidobacterium cuniculi]|uniref:AIPR family protein n=1 Tax=Bifidobacterium cuniculi TaxID=1688 RepID=UPI0009E09755|nr:AIPR family protein [Bifidobacterium cuniculi]